MDESQLPMETPRAKRRKVQMFALVTTAVLLVFGVLVVSGGARQIVILVRDAANALGILG
ncbi:hypothetical protein [Pseudoclavibacter sp. RFBG4]|uniref:hypothetical protein n=1 Tax=Pseudoclavibacter sp. RFBG4 TaxID=2080575 RepID=UPI0011B0CCCF|nr:hypothetical protein [Pseudoclavibacter sp. RFBG4]